MKKILSVILITLFLVGCTSQPIIKYKYINVDVLVPVEAPQPPNFGEVELPIQLLTNIDKSNYSKIAKAFATSITILEKELEKRDIALNAYRKGKNKNEL